MTIQRRMSDGGVVLVVSKESEPRKGIYRMVSSYAKCDDLSKGHVRRMCRAGQLEAIRVGAWWLVWDGEA